MKLAIAALAIVLSTTTAWGDVTANQTVGMKTSPSPEGAVSAPQPAASAPAPTVVERVGKIWNMQECGGAAGNDQRVDNITSNTVAQVVQKSFLGTLWQMTAAEAVGNAAGDCKVRTPNRPGPWCMRTYAACTGCPRS